MTKRKRPLAPPTPSKEVKPPPPPEPPKKDPAQERADDIEAMVKDHDLSRNDLLDKLLAYVEACIEEQRTEANKAGLEEGLIMGRQDAADEVCEALSVIGTDWDSGRSLLERALGGKIFGLGTARVELF